MFDVDAFIRRNGFDLAGPDPYQGGRKWTFNQSPLCDHHGDGPFLIQFRPGKPFPIAVLPGVVGEYVCAASTAIGCDPSFVALPLLGCLARAIGNKRSIKLKRTWTELPIVWAAIIGKSGTHKTPAIQAALHFLQRTQAGAIVQHAEARALLTNMTKHSTNATIRHGSGPRATNRHHGHHKSRPASDTSSATLRSKHWLIVSPANLTAF